MLRTKAIETHYAGYRMRSRLEARWSIYFDALELEWVYEHEGFILPGDEYYLPDFWFPSWGCFAEVKPNTFTQEEYHKASLLPYPCILLDLPAPKVFSSYFVTHHDWSDYQNYLSGNTFGRMIFEPSKAKDRLWFLLGENVGDYWMDMKPEHAALSARFEFGENGL